MHGSAPVRAAFVDQTGDESGGAQESFFLLLRHLPKQIDALAVLFHDGPFARRLREAGTRVAIVPAPRTFSGAKRESVTIRALAAAPGFAAALRACFIRERISVVYTHTVKAHFAALPAARLSGIPAVAHLRDILQGPALSALSAVLRTCSSERIAISQAVARAYHVSPRNVVLNPLDLTAYRGLPSRGEARAAMHLDPSRPLVGIVGRINRWKGHDTFLRAAAQIARRSDANFIIAGSPVFRDEDFMHELHALARGLDIGERVMFVPWTQDVRAVYAALDVLVNCSVKEPFGRSVAEAAACGVPSVCFDDAGVAEVLQNGRNGAVVPAGDVAALAHAVCRCLSTGEAMREDVVRLAALFDPNAHAAEVSKRLLRAAAVLAA